MDKKNIKTYKKTNNSLKKTYFKNKYGGNKDDLIDILKEIDNIDNDDTNITNVTKYNNKINEFTDKLNEELCSIYTTIESLKDIKNITKLIDYFKDIQKAYDDYLNKKYKILKINDKTFIIPEHYNYNKFIDIIELFNILLGFDDNYDTDESAFTNIFFSMKEKKKYLNIIINFFKQLLKKLERIKDEYSYFFIFNFLNKNNNIINIKNDIKLYHVFNSILNYDLTISFVENNNNYEKKISYKNYDKDIIINITMFKQIHTFLIDYNPNIKNNSEEPIKEKDSITKKIDISNKIEILTGGGIDDDDIEDSGKFNLKIITSYINIISDINKLCEDISIIILNIYVLKRDIFFYYYFLYNILNIKNMPENIIFFLYLSYDTIFFYYEVLLKMEKKMLEVTDNKIKITLLNYKIIILLLLNFFKIILQHLDYKKMIQISTCGVETKYILNIFNFFKNIIETYHEDQQSNYRIFIFMNNYPDYAINSTIKMGNYGRTFKYNKDEIEFVKTGKKINEQIFMIRQQECDKPIDLYFNLSTQLKSNSGSLYIIFGSPSSGKTNLFFLAYNNIFKNMICQLDMNTYFVRIIEINGKMIKSNYNCSYDIITYVHNLYNYSYKQIQFEKLGYNLENKNNNFYYFKIDNINSLIRQLLHDIYKKKADEKKLLINNNKYNNNTIPHNSSTFIIIIEIIIKINNKYIPFIFIDLPGLKDPYIYFVKNKDNMIYNNIDILETIKNTSSVYSEPLSLCFEEPRVITKIFNDLPIEIKKYILETKINIKDPDSLIYQKTFYEDEIEGTLISDLIYFDNFKIKTQVGEYIAFKKSLFEQKFQILIMIIIIRRITILKNNKFFNKYLVLKHFYSQVMFILHIDYDDQIHSIFFQNDFVHTFIYLMYRSVLYKNMTKNEVDKLIPLKKFDYLDYINNITPLIDELCDVGRHSTDYLKIAKKVKKINKNSYKQEPLTLTCPPAIDILSRYLNFNKLGFANISKFFLMNFFNNNVSSLTSNVDIRQEYTFDIVSDLLDHKP